MNRHARLCLLVPAFAVIAALALGAPASAAAAEDVPKAAAAGYYSYAVKFVCGFNRTNVGWLNFGYYAGENSVKIGNYATEINIYNPRDPTTVTPIKKLFILLVKEGFPEGREPNYAKPAVSDSIDLRGTNATMDDCNRLAELIYGPAGVPTPLPLFVGFLVLQSSQELDVTAVYTAELCSDWVFGAPGDIMCVDGHGAFGAGISIDVEQVNGRFVP